MLLDEKMHPAGSSIGHIGLAAAIAAVNPTVGINIIGPLGRLSDIFQPCTTVPLGAVSLIKTLDDTRVYTGFAAGGQSIKILCV